MIRADPATYEQVPPIQKDILPFPDWRSAFFDEQTCSPRPNTPIFEGAAVPTIAASDAPPANTTAYPSPADVLEASPVVRSHFCRLVDLEGGGGAVNENDFWSRYYYRVWCLDVLELRRARLAKISSIASEAMTGSALDKEAEAAQEEAWPGECD